MPQTYQTIRDLLSAGDFSAVFRQLPKLLQFDAPELSALNNLERQYLEYTRDQIRGTVRREDLKLTINKISLALLTLLNELEEQDAIPAAGRTGITKSTLRNIRALLKRQDDIPQAFSRLEDFLEHYCPEEMPLLSALWLNFNTNRENHIIKQTISHDDYTLAMNKIVFSLEELLLKLIKQEEQVDGSGIVFGSELAVVNCDRKKIVRRFLQAFEKKENSRRAGHIYLLHHQRYGQSESLIRRLITNLKQQYPGVKYSGFHQITIKRVEIEPGDTLEDCRFNLRKGFNRGLRPEVGSLAELLEKVHEHYPQFSRSTYVPFVLKIKIPSSQWASCGLPGIQWFVEEFCALPSRKKQIPLFFLVLDLETQAHKSKKSSIFKRFFGDSPEATEQVFDAQQELLQLVKDSSVPCTILPPLMRVREDDLLDWIEVFISNEKEREERVAELVAELGDNPEGWYMSDVERLLKKLVEEFHNTAVNL